ncbi:tetratricopeptide repeat protein [Rhizobium sp. SG2393]|uniref:tetratricopeptide repeat protein n=1 Tax=Rhizobium sp. SG2393 TaxID=3276279 RepID=UPI003672CDDA
MRKDRFLRLLNGAAIIAVMGLGAAVVSAEDKPAEPKAEVTFETRDVNTFSGAYLAARTADIDRDFVTATELYRKALALQPDNADIAQRLMITYLMNGDFKKAVESADTLKSDASVERITSMVRGVDAIQSKNYRKAGEILKYEGPNDLDRLMTGLLQAWAIAGEGKTKQALSAVDKLEGPEWFGIFKNYVSGTIALQAGDLDAARSRLNTTILDRDGASGAPDTFMRAVFALARLEANAGNKQKALDTIAVGEGVVNNYTPLDALRASIEKGEKQVQQVATPADGAASVLFAVAAALNRGGAEDIVTLYLQTARALDPDSADILIMLGGIAETLKKPEQAVALYRQVPDDSPMRRLSELQLGLSLASVGRVDEAKTHLQALIDQDPKNMRSYLALGSVLSDAKDYKAMGALYDRAAEAIGPTPQRSDWTIFFQRGIAYERLKEWPKAEPNFKKALELNPDQAQVLNYLGYSWVDMNMNLDEAMNMIRKAVELKPDDGYIVDSLGWAYFRLGKFDEAVVELERAAELMAGDPTINDHLGDAYWRVGRKLEATFQWRQALELKPEPTEIPKIQAKIDNGLPPLDNTIPAADAGNGVQPKKEPEADVATGKKS